MDDTAESADDQLSYVGTSDTHNAHTELYQKSSSFFHHINKRLSCSAYHVHNN